MTFVGRILVLVITALSLVFLGVSTVVFTTATNWKQATTKLREDVSKEQAKVRDLTAEVDAQKKNQTALQATHKVALKKQEDIAAALQAQLDQTRKEIEAA